MTPAGITGNDRKFEVFEIRTYDPEAKGMRLRKVQVYAHPKDGYRGSETERFVASYDGVVVSSSDIQELRRKLVEVHSKCSEADYEKVLIVKTTGWKNRGGQNPGDEFGIEWSIGWQVAKLGVIFNETRSYCVTIDNAEPEDVTEGTLKVGSTGSENKTAVVPWTPAREEAIRMTVENIGRMRAATNQMLTSDLFASLLDKSGFKLLTASAGVAEEEK